VANWSVRLIETCADCGETVCLTDIEECVHCSERFCADHQSRCGTCGHPVCDTHSTQCVDDGDLNCNRHISSCSVCEETTKQERPRCENHLERCVTGKQLLCSDHSYRDPILDEVVCAEHQAECATCRQTVASDAIDDGNCRTCQNLSKDDALQSKVEPQLPDTIDFRSMKINENSQYVVIHGKRLLRSNKMLSVGPGIRRGHRTVRCWTR